jgi:hypothetical protein
MKYSEPGLEQTIIKLVQEKYPDCEIIAFDPGPVLYDTHTNKYAVILFKHPDNIKAALKTLMFVEARIHTSTHGMTKDSPWYKFAKIIEEHSNGPSSNDFVLLE